LRLGACTVFGASAAGVPVTGGAGISIVLAADMLLLLISGAAGGIPRQLATRFEKWPRKSHFKVTAVSLAYETCL
jgi:hypothetical protein